jgi:PHP family Zn ribbon phosphoesterase
MDMTPNNIVNMAKLKGLDLIALTDHNSCANCAAAVRAGAREGLLVLPGMELCTREEIHVVCLFETPAAAESFAAEIYPLLPAVRNRPDIFGEQVVMDEWDHPAGREEKLLITAADIGVDGVCAAAGRFGGAAFPAHADKTANGIIQILGAVPPEAGFASAELSPGCARETFAAAHPELAGMMLLTDSDAHYLWQIAEREHALELPELTARAVLEIITMQNQRKR